MPLILYLLVLVTLDIQSIGNMLCSSGVVVPLFNMRYVLALVL